MEIKKKKVTVVIEVWDCGVQSHRHRTEDAAIHCRERRPHGTSKSVILSHYHTVLRNVDIFKRLIVNGESRASLAREYGLQESTVGLIAKQLGSWSLYRAGIITYDDHRRGLREWKKHKDEASDFIEKIREHAHRKLKLHTEED